jgi:hypothetical protein
MLEHYVDCSKKDCKYNMFKECQAPAIQVGGEVTCETYLRRTDSSSHVDIYAKRFGFEVGHEMMPSMVEAQGHTIIACNAMGCTYNHNTRQCDKRTIKVENEGGGEADCASFRKDE